MEENLAVVLFDGLGPIDFGKLVSSDKHLHSFKIWEALEKAADRISFDTLWAVKNYMGFPSPQNCPRLHAILAEATNDSASEYLIETIDGLAATESDKGSSMSAHARAMSAFRYMH